MPQEVAGSSPVERTPFREGSSVGRAPAVSTTDTAGGRRFKSVPSHHHARIAQSAEHPSAASAALGGRWFKSTSAHHSCAISSAGRAQPEVGPDAGTQPRRQAPVVEKRGRPMAPSRTDKGTGRPPLPWSRHRAEVGGSSPPSCTTSREGSSVGRAPAVSLTDAAGGRRFKSVPSHHHARIAQSVERLGGPVGRAREVGGSSPPPRTLNPHGVPPHEALHRRRRPPSLPDSRPPRPATHCAPLVTSSLTWTSIGSRSTTTSSSWSTWTCQGLPLSSRRADCAWRAFTSPTSTASLRPSAPSPRPGRPCRTCRSCVELRPQDRRAAPWNP